MDHQLDLAQRLRADGSSVAVHPWRHALGALLLLWLATLLLYRDTATTMVGIWARSDTFAHAFLVPPIAVWLVWRQRRALAWQTPQPAPAALALTAGAALLWLLGELAAVNAVTQTALVALLVSTVPAVLGWPLTRRIIFPLGFLFFAVPIGEFLLPQLMEWTADFTVLALRLSGIPVYREGLQFVIPSGHWSVVEACSGVRYLIASLTVGTLFAYLNYQSSKRRLLFVLVALLVPVVANWLRAYLIVMLGHLSGNKLAVGVDHLVYGWLFFGVVIMLMFVIGARWAEPAPAPGPTGPEPGAQPPAVRAARPWATAVGVAALLAAPHIALTVTDRGANAGPAQWSAPLALASGWQAAPAEVTGFKPAFQNPSAEINRGYHSQGRTVGLYLAAYRHQDARRELVSSSNVLVVSDDPRWVRVSSGSRPLTLGGQPVALRTAELRARALAGPGQDARLVAWQLYWINGTLTASDHMAKVYAAFYRLSGRGDDAAVIIAYTAGDQAGGADAVLADFLTTNYGAINELLRKTR